MPVDHQLSGSLLGLLPSSRPVLRWTGLCAAYCLELSLPLSTANLVRASRFWHSTFAPPSLVELSGEVNVPLAEAWFTFVLKAREASNLAFAPTLEAMLST